MRLAAFCLALVLLAPAAWADPGYVYVNYEFIPDNPSPASPSAIVAFDAPEASPDAPWSIPASGQFDARIAAILFNVPSLPPCSRWSGRSSPRTLSRRTG